MKIVVHFLTDIDQWRGENTNQFMLGISNFENKAIKIKKFNYFFSRLPQKVAKDIFHHQKLQFEVQ